MFSVVEGNLSCLRPRRTAIGLRGLCSDPVIERTGVCVGKFHSKQKVPYRADPSDANSTNETNKFSNFQRSTEISVIPWLHMYPASKREFEVASTRPEDHLASTRLVFSAGRRRKIFLYVVGAKDFFVAL